MWSRKPSLIRHSAALALVSAAALAASLAHAEPPALSEWTAQKCVLYGESWDWVLRTQDLSDISPRFLTDHQSFIEARCDHSITICPETAAELKLADLLTILSMNEGMASTFVPFACP